MCLMWCYSAGVEPIDEAEVSLVETMDDLLLKMIRSVEFFGFE